MANMRRQNYSNSYSNRERREERRIPEKKIQAPELTRQNYVDEAEKAIKSLRVRDKYGNMKINLTTSKIRNILSLMTELYNDVTHETSEELGEEYVERIQYIRLRIAYEAGRDKVVEDFEKKSNLLAHIKKLGNNKESFLLFFRYMEALVAYHRFYGGKDA